MGYRLSKIYTKTGDDGTSALSDGLRQPKYALCFEALGDIDELNSQIGMMVAFLGQTQTDFETTQLQAWYTQLQQIQQQLFNIGGMISMPNLCLIHSTEIDQLEQSIDAMNEQLPKLTNFILPRGHLLTCATHLARAMCRRAERHTVQLAIDIAIDTNALKYLNRLSDWLFVFARTVESQSQQPEILWQQPHSSEPIE